MNGLPLDHIGIAVSSLEQAMPTFEYLTGTKSSPIEEVPSQHARVSFVGHLELIEPTSPDGPIARFIEKRGEGLHHVAFRVDDIPTELERLAAEGYRLIDTAPRPGAGGHKVAFIHPKSANGVLIELVQH